VVIAATWLASRGSTDSKESNLMYQKRAAAPDSTAVRVALWRAMHIQVDLPPPGLEDEIGVLLP
jgi:hypothetical protein